MTHSPLPWTINGFGDIIDADNRVVIPNGWHLFPEDRAHIVVSAVNAHERMRKALEAAEELLRENYQSLVDGYTVLYPPDPDYGKLDAEGREMVAPYEAALAQIRAALAGEG